MDRINSTTESMWWHESTVGLIILRDQCQRVPAGRPYTGYVSHACFWLLSAATGVTIRWISVMRALVIWLRMKWMLPQTEPSAESYPSNSWPSHPKHQLTLLTSELLDKDGNTSGSGSGPGPDWLRIKVNTSSVVTDLITEFCWWAH